MKESAWGAKNGSAGGAAKGSARGANICGAWGADGCGADGMKEADRRPVGTYGATLAGLGTGPGWRAPLKMRNANERMCDDSNLPLAMFLETETVAAHFTPIF